MNLLEFKSSVKEATDKYDFYYNNEMLDKIDPIYYDVFINLLFSGNKIDLAVRNLDKLIVLSVNSTYTVDELFIIINEIKI